MTEELRRRAWTRLLSAVPPERRRWAIVALVGWWLSPLTAWNDAFTNIPISIAAAYVLRALGAPVELKVTAVVVYLLTNVLGLAMLAAGLGKLSWAELGPLSRRGLLRLAARTVVYAFLVALVIWSIERMLAGLDGV